MRLARPARQRLTRPSYSTGVRGAPGYDVRRDRSADEPSPAELRVPDFGPDVVEVYPGATKRTNKANTYSVGWRTLTAGPDGAPTAPPAAVLAKVTVTFDGHQRLVSAATVGALVLP